VRLLDRWLRRDRKRMARKLHGLDLDELTGSIGPEPREAERWQLP
jgi:hypothetical protein